VFNPVGIERVDPAICILDFPRRADRILFISARGDTAGRQILEWVRVYERFYRARTVFLAEVPPAGYSTYAAHAFDAQGRPVRILDHLSEPLVAAWHPEIEDQRTYWKPLDTGGEAQTARTRGGNLRFESSALIVEIDPRTGGIVHLLDRRTRWDAEAPSGQLARLRPVGDNSGDSTTWNMRLTGEDTTLAPISPPRVLSHSPVCRKIRVPYAFGNSRFFVDFTVYKRLPRIDIAVHSGWRERLKTLKMSFPLNLRASVHLRSIPFGAIERPNDGVGEPAQRWVALRDGNHGVVLANRNNPGHAFARNEVSVTLLCSPVDPDPVAGVGEHHSLLALRTLGAGPWAIDPAEIGIRISTPLIAIHPKARGSLPGTMGLFRCDRPGVRVTCVKRTEDGREYVVRLVETRGRQVLRARIEFTRPLRNAHECNLLEETVRRVPVRGGQIAQDLGPYQIRTLRIEFAY